MSNETKIKKLKSSTELAEDMLFKFGSAPGSREWDFMRFAFRKGYQAGVRRAKKVRP